MLHNSENRLQSPFTGCTTEADCYLLPSCRLGRLELNNLELTVAPRADNGTGIDLEERYPGQTPCEGALGRNLLHRTNIFLDLPRSLIWLVDREEHLGAIGVDLEQCERVGFEEPLAGLVCSVRTDFGDRKFLIDTGCSMSVVPPEHLSKLQLEEDARGNVCYVSDQLVLGNFDFGSQILYSLDISPSLGGFDGILGIDFLLKHAFYIDYPNKLLYFQR